MGLIFSVHSQAFDAAPQPVPNNHLPENHAFSEVIVHFPALLDRVLLQHQDWLNTSRNHHS